MPFFTVIIPCFNREQRILGAINSVLAQNFTDFEIIIIDDASVDNSVAVIEGVMASDTRISLLQNSLNQERCISRNRALEIAKGKYCCFLDSDDYYLSNHLQLLYDKIIQIGVNGFYFTNSWNELENGERSERNCPDYTPNEPYKYFLRYTVNPDRWALETGIFQKVLFDPEVTICEDMELTLRLVANEVPIFHVNERSIVYVAAEDSFTFGDPKKWEKELFYLKRIFNKPILKSKLPKLEINRLLSICYYHLAIKNHHLKEKSEFYKFASLSIFKYPKGYNKNVLKSLSVLLILNIPIVGKLFKRIFGSNKG